MVMNQSLRSYLRSLGISEKEIAGYNLLAYNGNKTALKAAIDQAIHNALRSGLSPEDDSEDESEDESDAYELEDDEGEDAEDVAHLPGRQKRDKAEQRERQLTEVAGRLATFVGSVSLDELRRQAQCGNVRKEREAAAKIQALYREADRFLSE